MGCLGGTVDRPRRWHRVQHGEETEQYGRICGDPQLSRARTSRRVCSWCSAFRGKRADGTLATGIDHAGDWYAMSHYEYELWEKAQEAAFEDDDFTAQARVLNLMETGVGERTLRFIGDPDAQDRWAKVMRQYRAEHPEVRQYHAAHMRAWRARQGEALRAKERERKRKARAAVRE